MTQAQADSYHGATDNILFSSGSASQATVIFNPLTATSVPFITLTLGAKSLNFADDPSVIRGQNNLTFFPDGSKLYIGLTGDDAGVTGTGCADGLVGSTGDDT